MTGMERMKAQLGGHIRESMGGSASAAAGGPLPVPAATNSGQYQGCTRPKDTLTIEVSRLAPDPDQPRKEFDPDALANLAGSLTARGQLQPIRVRWDGVRSAWTIVSGERRWRAAAIAGLSTLACVEVKGELTPDDILEDQLVENCVREDLKPIEQARSFRALIDRRGCSLRHLAESLNISHMAVSRALALLELPAAVQDRVEQGTLAPSVAYEVAKLADADAQAEVAERIVSEGLSRAEVVEEVRRASSRPNKGTKGRGTRPRKTSTAFRATNGYKLTAEFRRGVEDDGLLAALLEMVDQIRVRRESRGEAA